MTMRLQTRALVAVFFGFMALGRLVAAGDSIPLPEHPRPDFERADWVNLNGNWEFRFDGADAGEAAGWMEGGVRFDREIVVPFPWGSELSGVEDEADIAWYGKSFVVPESWKGRRVFLVVGASDWLTRAWFDGEAVGAYQGGYTPFEFELTDAVSWGEEQRMVLRVDDSPHPFKLEGKQGYGEAKGIWQTVYLEARARTYVERVHFTPHVDAGTVGVEVELSGDAAEGVELGLRFRTGGVADFRHAVKKGTRLARFEVPIEEARLWSLDDPFLYEVDVALVSGEAVDEVSTYFGMRTIGVELLPGTNIPYVALNGKPVYLQLALDQSYHEGGYYTFPSDAFMRDEILRSKRLGLNGNRVHIKVEVPRKLYWADRLGLLIMADVPNFWGEPTAQARGESETALREMIKRDFNHPSIFSWVTFNETWGLFSGEGEERAYLPETQEWVRSIYHLTKQLDPTRLVEDNSPCNHDHVDTDLNTWHDYLPGYLWKDRLDQISRDTFPGSGWNFIGDNVQRNQPNFNSECGNVWGYTGSTGDVDWTWDYHIMMNEFRRHPKVSGWLYTEHHDVINEWNGYYRFDRSEKETGLGEIVSGMSIRDLHSPFYLSTGSELCRDVVPGQRVEVPVFASFMTDAAPSAELVVRTQLFAWDSLGRKTVHSDAVARRLAFEPWMARELEPLEVAMPEEASLAVLALSLESVSGAVLQRNFTTFLVADGLAARDESIEEGGTKLRVVRFSPGSFASQDWSQKQWNVLDGLKANGAGSGYFEYRLAWPEGLDLESVGGATLVFEASAKRLFGKDREGATVDGGDFMRGKGTHDPSALPNSYPMSDDEMFPSQVFVRVNGVAAGARLLADDPADHRGILSWRMQTRYRDIENDAYADRKLVEAGSYGYLVEVALPAESLERAFDSGELAIRLEVDESLAGGLAIYGERFGAYPVDPAVVFELK